jgi:two-component system cell cycle response regulator CpdR
MLQLTLLVAGGPDTAFRAAFETLSARTSAKVGREVVFTPRMTRATDPAQSSAATVELEDWDAVHEVARTGCLESFVDDLPEGPGRLAIVVREVRTQRPNRAGPAQRILVVDDEPHLRRLAARILTVDGHTVFEAASAAEASDILARNVVDTVVSDLMMPGEDGFALADTVARRFPSARFVIASGISRDIDPIDALVRRVSVVLSKPYSVAELREAVQRETVELDTA